MAVKENFSVLLCQRLRVPIKTSDMNVTVTKFPHKYFGSLIYCKFPSIVSTLDDFAALFIASPDVNIEGPQGLILTNRS